MDLQHPEITTVQYTQHLHITMVSIVLSGLVLSVLGLSSERV